MAITKATIPGSLFAQLISMGSPYVRLLKIRNSMILWDAHELEPKYLEEFPNFSSGSPQLDEQKDGRFTRVFIRERFAKTLTGNLRGGVDVITIGKFMIVRDSKQTS